VYHHYNLTGVTEMWWDSSHGWSAATEGSGVLGVLQGEGGEGTAVHVRAAGMCGALPRDG